MKERYCYRFRTTKSEPWVYFEAGSDAEAKAEIHRRMIGERQLQTYDDDFDFWYDV